MKRDLADPELFGNEAGEDEPLDVLNSYFVDKPDFGRFFSSDTRIEAAGPLEFALTVPIDVTRATVQQISGLTDLTFAGIEG